MPKIKVKYGSKEPKNGTYCELLGIYKKILLPCPFFKQFLGIAMHFFCICPKHLANYTYIGQKYHIESLIHKK